MCLCSKNKLGRYLYYVQRESVAGQVGEFHPKTAQRGETYSIIRANELHSAAGHSIHIFFLLKIV